MRSSASPAARSSSTSSSRVSRAVAWVGGAVLRREPYRLLFPLGALLAWAGVLPWLFFAFRLRSIYEPVTGVLAYRSFLHPLAELDGFLGCFAAGVILTALRPPPAGWQIVVAAVAPLISATCAAIGQWQLGQVASLALLAVMLQFTLRRLSRPLSPSLLWIAFGFVMGAGGAAVVRPPRPLDARRGQRLDRCRSADPARGPARDLPRLLYRAAARRPVPARGRGPGVPPAQAGLGGQPGGALDDRPCDGGARPD